MRLSSAAFVLALLFAGPASADLAPLPPPPPKPAGPQTAAIRGLTVAYQLGYWRGRRWLIAVTACAAGTAACKDRDLVDCVVMLQEGSVPTIPDLIAADKKAGTGPLQLRIERCAASAKSNDLSL